MDNCPSHVTDDIIGLLTEARVRAITFAPQATQIFQVFDMALVGVLKGHPRSELAFEDEKMTVKFRMKVSHGFKERTMNPNT
jgi:hypothetical protein